MQKISMDQLMARMMRTPMIINAEMELGIKRAAVKVRDTATKKFGEYQPAVGEFPAWDPLAESTVEAKTKAGGGEDPLIGHYAGNSKNAAYPTPLRTTLEIVTEGLTAEVGSKDPLGKIHEYGASGAGKNHDVTIPPRPFLRPALYENQDVIKEEVAAALAAGLMKM